MPFGEFKLGSDSRSFDKPEFFVFTPGEHLIRILNEEPYTELCYWFGRGYIKALGWDDPVAEQNKVIKLENPENYRNVKGYHGLQERLYTNVLDMTPAKVCPKCGADVKSVDGIFPMMCPKCNTAVTSIESAPLNKVRVLSGTKNFWENFDKFEKTELDESGEFIGWTSFDIQLLVAGEGRGRNVVPRSTGYREAREVPEDALFDLESITPKLTEDELEHMLRGVSFKDVMAARRATSDLSELDEDDQLSEEDQAQIQESLENIF